MYLQEMELGYFPIQVLKFLSSDIISAAGSLDARVALYNTRLNSLL